ncbi:T9SS type A sorting domain-containing protein, partial [candidate division WOR-3 bacterium]|nr:T9SS type A sorting domain-containing protein [candidate division WOR-3 bacterium]
CAIDLHSGAFNTIVEGCSLIGPPYTNGIYFHNRGAGLLAQNNYVKNMHWGLFCGHTNEGHFIKDVVFKNNTVENTERYGGCAWRDAGNRILSNVSFIDNTFIHCSQQSGYHNLVLVRVDTAHVEGNSFVESLIPDEPHIRFGEVSNGLVLNLGDDFTRIQVYATDARLEFSDGKAFTEDGNNQPFWFPDHSEYLLNLDETIEVTTYKMTIVPSTDSVEVIVLQWDTTGTYYKNWQEISENPSVITSHTIDNFPAYAQVEVLVNSVPYDTFVTDSTGWFSFDYTGGFVQDTVTFETIYLTGIEDERKSGQIPVSFSLNQNYPNPFKSITEIRYNLARESVVELSVFNILGEKMKTLVKENQHPGCYTIHWDGCDQRGNKMANGVYFYQLRVGNHAIRRKAIIRR